MTGLEVMIASTAFQAVGSIAQGLQGASLAKYNARVAERNAQQEQLNAAAEADRKRRAGSRYLGAMRARAGAAGVDLSGDVAEDVAAQIELDAETSLWEGELTAQRLRSDAALYRAQAKSAMAGGIFGAMGSALGGLEKFYARNPSGVANPGYGGPTGRSYASELAGGLRPL